MLVVESNYDPDLLAAGPYPAALRRRVAGAQGHLSNAQAADLIRRVAGPRLHTIVLAHLSLKNNTPELALEAARRGLESARSGANSDVRPDVRILIASQDEPTEAIDV